MNRITFFILISLSFFSSEIIAQTWVQKASLPAKGRHRLCGIAIGNKAFVGLGHMNGTGVNIIYKDWWEFDPISNTWTQKADYPTVNGNYGVAAFGTSTHGFVGGGTQLTNEFFKYDPIINSWSPIANCPSAPNDQTAFSIQDKGYVQDGIALYEYDQAIDTWSIKSSMPSGGGGIWTCSFTNETSGFVKVGSQLFEYKSDIDTWIERATFPGLATGGSGAFAVDGNGYIVGGYAAGLADVQREVWKFDIGLNTWTQMEDSPGAGRRFCIGLNVNNRGYYGLGTNGINFNDWWAADTFFLKIKENQLDITLFPNPMVDYFNIVGQNVVGKNLKIFDQNGKVVKELTLNSEQIDVADLPTGTYLIKVMNEGTEIFSKSIVKQ